MNSNYKSKISPFSEKHLSLNVDTDFFNSINCSDEKNNRKSFTINGFFFGLCTEGNANLTINYRNHKILPNSVVVLLPNQAVSIYEKSKNFQIESLYFSSDFITLFPSLQKFRVFFSIRETPILQISHSSIKKIREYYPFIESRLVETETPYSDNVIKGLVFSLVSEILSLYALNIEHKKLSGSSRQDEIVENFFKLLLQHCDSERSVAYYADRLCITPKYLSTTVKWVTGRSVLSWIHEVFIANSKVLLKSTNKSITEISDELNMSTDSFFCRLFKKHTGMSPLEYRKLA
ncbi:AraC family transcriptional regulator [Bacteroidales bacterium OttesenSCG-928-I21]|nr:AraC family transcriptional regulator [Bacteroidales bacterium OttesenSCG-928-I21]